MSGIAPTEGLFSKLTSLAKGLRQLIDVFKIRTAVQDDSPRQADMDSKPILIEVPKGIQIHKSPSDKRDESKYQEKNLFWQRLTLFSVLAYASITLSICVANWKAACAAKKAADTARRQLEVSERAWITVESPPQYEADRSRIVWRLQNLGKSPAFRIAAAATTLKPTEDAPSVQDKMCRDVESPERPTKVPLELLFPNQIGRPRRANWVSLLGQADHLSAPASVAGLVGCISYRDQFSDHRWTRFCYEVDVTQSPPSLIECFNYNSTDADNEAKTRNR